jgi:hypothetical protein
MIFMVGIIFLPSLPFGKIKPATLQDASRWPPHGTNELERTAFHQVVGEHDHIRASCLRGAGHQCSFHSGL